MVKLMKQVACTYDSNLTGLRGDHQTHDQPIHFLYNQAWCARTSTTASHNVFNESMSIFLWVITTTTFQAQHSITHVAMFHILATQARVAATTQQFAVLQ